MGGGKRASALLSMANAEVKVADHLLSVMHEMTKDPKVLLGVANHAKTALSYAAEALLFSGSSSHVEDAISSEEHSRSTVPFPNKETLVASGMKVAVASTAVETFTVLSDIVVSHASSPTAFTRKERYIIADEGFASIKEVSFDDMSVSLNHVKNFVHEVNKKIIFGGGE